MDATEADGYVVSISTSDEPPNSTLLDNVNVTQYTLGGLQFNNYSIEVRAYQDLLGPAGTLLDVTIEGLMLFAHAVVIHFHIFNSAVAYILSLNWSLLSSRNDGSVTYRVNCITSYVDHFDYIHWKVNGKAIQLSSAGVKNNGSVKLNESDLTYQHTLVVYGATNETINFTCEAMILGNRLSQSITIQGYTYIHNYKLLLNHQNTFLFDRTLWTTTGC